jgi:hypothetical protein
MVILLIPKAIDAQERENDAAQGQQTDPQGSQSQQVEPQQGQALTPNGKTVKKPPPPLFPKHSRGMYRNGLGLQVIDSTPQSPPLEVDDPSVPDKGQYEINLTSQADSSKQLRAIDFLLVDANYGTLPRILGRELPTQIKLDFPLAGAFEPGTPTKIGLGSAEFGIKFNFYNNEHHGASLAFYPQIEFAVPGTGAVEKKLAEVGQTLVFPLLAAKEFKYVTIVGNGAVNQPIHDPMRDTTGTLGFGAGRALSRRTAAMLEIRGDSSFNFNRDRLVVANFGLMRGLRENVILYGNVGHSIFSDDGSQHFYFGFGVKFLLASGKSRSN